MDRPAAGERRRRAVPLGLYAARRSARGAERDPACAAIERPGCAGGVGLRPAQPLGAAAGPRADRAWRSPQRPRREPRGRSRSATPSACASYSQQAGFAEIDVQALEIVQRHDSFDTFWETTLDISNAFHDAVLSRPEPEIAEICTGLADAPGVVHQAGRDADDPRGVPSSRPRAPDPGVRNRASNR